MRGLEHYDVSLWTPEVGGRNDWHAEDHEQTMLALGLSSKREIAPTRIRVRTAIATQTREQGRLAAGAWDAVTRQLASWAMQHWVSLP